MRSKPKLYVAAVFGGTEDVSARTAAFPSHSDAANRYLSRSPADTMSLEETTMATEPIPPYPKNAPGDFYVEDGCCITCEAPYHEAPDLIAHDEEGDYPHCYFKRQPETPEEVERAVMACNVSCVRAVRYAGKNQKILKRFRELGSEDSCDVGSGREVDRGEEKPGRGRS
jgi:hypothetical protein